jgi:hypothetical protein
MQEDIGSVLNPFQQAIAYLAYSNSMNKARSNFVVGYGKGKSRIHLGTMILFLTQTNHKVLVVFANDALMRKDLAELEIFLDYTKAAYPDFKNRVRY